MISETIKEIPIDMIETGRFNPRKTFSSEHIQQLSASIKRDGQWNPIIVRSNGNGKYDLLAGECRLRAIKKLKFSTIKARIIHVNDDEAFLLALKTNVMRRDLNLVEEAYGIKKLREKNWDVERILKALNKSKQWVVSRLKLAEDATEGLQNAVLSGILSIGSAVKIAELPEGLQGPVASKAERERLNIKKVEKLVDVLKLATKNKDIVRLLRTPVKEIMNLKSNCMMSPQARGLAVASTNSLKLR